MSQFQLNLAESELKIILESLVEMELKMAQVCETSQDEDEIADVGNDLIEVRLLLNSVREKSILQYGNNIMNFSREAF
ncbi:hypothetical protein ACROAE_06250 [Shewanella sp. MF05960]|uniref:hypothetical protein n=1 Tax=Shewanella sp. MF05960 TaxID=3434874 RepID=UPI003D7B775A